MQERDYSKMGPKELNREFHAVFGHTAKLVINAARVDQRVRSKARLILRDRLTRLVTLSDTTNSFQFYIFGSFNTASAEGINARNDLAIGFREFLDKTKNGAGFFETRDAREFEVMAFEAHQGRIAALTRAVSAGFVIPREQGLSELRELRTLSNNWEVEFESKYGTHPFATRIAK